MTKRAVATQAQVRRNIKAARKEGLCITSNKPDGTLLVLIGDHAPCTSNDNRAEEAIAKAEEIVL